VDAIVVIYELVADELPGVRSPGADDRNAADHVVDQMKTIQIVQHHRIKGKGVMFAPSS